MLKHLPHVCSCLFAPLHPPTSARAPTSHLVKLSLPYTVADPGFSQWGGANSPGGRQHTILPNFPKNCMKLKEFGPQGGRASKILLCRSATVIISIIPLWSVRKQGNWNGFAESENENEMKLELNWHFRKLYFWKEDNWKPCQKKSETISLL